jgi:predicted transcriptional regulator
MNVERMPFAEETPEEEAASLARAEADIAAGRVVPHSEVVKWLQTWGTPEEGPPPAEWFK